MLYFQLYKCCMFGGGTREDRRVEARSYLAKFREIEKCVEPFKRDLWIDNYLELVKKTSGMVTIPENPLKKEG